MPRPQVIIEVDGGVVQNVFCSVAGIQVLLVDWDVEGSLPGEPGIVDVPLPHRSRHACISDVQVLPLDELAGTDIEAAIDAACEQGVLCDHDEARCV
jgi:hypothetical protein